MDLTKEFEKLQASIEEIKTMLTSQKETKKEVQSSNVIPPILAIKEVCKLLGLTEQGLFLKRKKGEILTVAKGNRVYITREEFERYLSNHTQFNQNKRAKK